MTNIYLELLYYISCIHEIIQTDKLNTSSYTINYKNKKINKKEKYLKLI